jgi:DNA-directed RNA polymerase subunit RPC12/RpoP
MEFLQLRLQLQLRTTMAGDHKCSVCQATFTRPQHVSRHMRSRKLLRPDAPLRPTNPCAFPTDTGDRPYKCQHCGDQFARRSVPPPIFHLPQPHSSPFALLNSDLLSRHINKCHPNEKPLVSSTPSRRKGTSSASRATTSKQACDQCVQSTLPCDGANPCCQSLVVFPLH